MDMVPGPGDHNGSCQRTVRQVHNEVTQSDVRAELVQFLSDDHNDRHLRSALVPEAPSEHAVQMEMVHSSDIPVHLHRRLRIFHLAQRSGFDDICSFARAPQLGDNILHLRSRDLQGKEHKGEALRPRPYPAGNGIHLDGYAVGCSSRYHQNYGFLEGKKVYL